MFYFSHLYSQDNQDLLAPVYFGGVYLPLERDPELSFKTPLIVSYYVNYHLHWLPYCMITIWLLNDDVLSYAESSCHDTGKACSILLVLIIGTRN